MCGVRVEEVDDPLMQKIRYLDKLIDELAKGVNGNVKMTPWGCGWHAMMMTGLLRFGVICVGHFRAMILDPYFILTRIHFSENTA